LFKVTAYAGVFLVAASVFSRLRSRHTRQIFLLAASYGLYLTWSLWFAGVLLFSTAINFAVGSWLQRKPSAAVLWAGIMFNLALLAIFKYLPPVAVSLPFSSVRSFSNIALPLGISFWTFQAMSYLFDLYRGEELDPTFVEFALYMVFFPVAISGPICRMPDMLPQFRSEEALAATDVERGFGRIATGVLMMQLAKLLGQGILSGDGINSGFDHLARWGGTDVWCLAFGYGLQLFFDFAGYSHIAIGAAKVLGFTLPENFARPFASTSPSIFWTRWHMSLSFWIRDYIFLPLATMRRELWWRNLALVGSMVVFGLWHKASLLFVLWGCYHGVLLVLQRLVERAQREFDWEPPRLWEPLSRFTTITLVSVGWIFFRANSLVKAGQMLAAIVSPASYSSHFASGSLYLLVMGLAVGYATVLAVADALDRRSTGTGAEAAQRGTGLVMLLARKRWVWIPPLYALVLLVVVVVTFTQDASTAQLMYRRF
jgi:alginate O-acetyltransferase complex protein AlgI